LVRELDDVIGTMEDGDGEWRLHKVSVEVLLDGVRLTPGLGGRQSRRDAN